jgi:hypothetical protein
MTAMNNTPIGYHRACEIQRESWALIQQGMALLRGPNDAVPPMDPRVPKLVAAREFVRELKEESR